MELEELKVNTILYLKSISFLLPAEHPPVSSYKSKKSTQNKLDL